MSQKTTTAHGPHRAHDTAKRINPTGTAYTIQDTKHTPWNKRSGAVEATADFEVSQGKDWVVFRMSEYVRTKTGITTRTISMTVPREQAERLTHHIHHGNRDIAAEDSKRERDPFVLVWNQLAEHEWQAGGSARYYSIMQDGELFSVTLCSGDSQTRAVSVQGSLDAAQQAAQDDFRKPRR